MRRALAQTIAFALALAGASACAGCAGAPPPRPRAPAVTEPRWEDVFDATPELLVVVRAAALRADKVYGPLLGRVLDLARQRSRVVAATRALDSIEDADEIILGIRPGSADAGSEVVVVIRGVRGDIDPGALVDGDGRPLWGPGPAGAIRELVRVENASGDESPVNASLFELPGRTWVIASGDARTRARDAFTHPLGRALGRPAIRFDDDALAVLRIDGSSLVSHVRPLKPVGPLAALGTRLRSVTFDLVSAPTSPETRSAPESGGPAPTSSAAPVGSAASGVSAPPAADADRDTRDVRATWTYADEDAAAAASVVMRELVGALGRKKPESLAWLGSAKVEHPGKTVVATATLPASLVGALLHAGSVPIGHITGEDPPPPP